MGSAFNIRTVRTSLRNAVVVGAVVAFSQGLPSSAQATSSGVQALPSRRIAELRKKIEADNRSHPVASVEWAEEALALLNHNQTDPKSETWFLLALVRDLTTVTEFPKATTYLKQARNLVARTGNERDHFLVEVEAASLFSSSGQSVEAKELLDALLPALEQYRAKYPKDSEIGRALVKAYLDLGRVCRVLGRFSDAIRACQQGQKIAQAVADPGGEARILDQMGTLYAILGRFDESVASHRLAIARAEALKDVELQAFSHLSLANAYGYKDEADSQLAELQTTLELAGRSQDSDIQLTAMVNMADGYLRKKDYRSTLKYAESALKMSLASNNASSIAVCQVNRGIALNRLGNSAEGIKAILEGLEYFKNSQALNDVAEITGSLAEEYAFSGDYRKAYETVTLNKKLSDDLHKTQDRKNIVAASAAFESDKKQLQIDALQRDQKLQSRLRLLWVALGGLGFATTGVLVLSRKKLKVANSALADMSLKDPLTSLANRRYLTTRIDEDLAQIHRLQRLGQSPSTSPRLLVNIDVIFLMIDIDHFKFVNDQHGHAAGDNVLRQFASILSQTMRDSDTVVRWGGEEFFVVAKHTSRLDSHMLAERIRSRVEEFPFDLGNGQTLHKTCSIGFSSYPFFRKDPSRVAWEKVAEVADQCLYAAKAMGRNTWVGVHEALGSEASYQESMGVYPDVADMVAKGVLIAESRADQPIAWQPSSL